MAADLEGNGRRISGAGSAIWIAVAALAALAAAGWLRDPSVGYLAVLAAATAGSLVLAAGMTPPARRWPLVWSAIAAIFLVAAVWFHARQWRIERDWPAVAMERARAAEARFAGELERAAERLIADARRAVRIEGEPWEELSRLRLPSIGAAEHGILLYERGELAAWTGRVRSVIPPEALDAGEWAADSVRLIATRTPFYRTLDAIVARGDRLARATTVVDAVPPADRLARSLAGLATEQGDHAGFEVAIDDTLSGGFLFPVARPVLSIRARPEVREQVSLGARVQAVEFGALLLAVALVALVVAVWRDTRSRPRRLVALAVALAAVAFTPLSILSGRGALFDPGFYYAALGGPFTATAGSFAATAAILLLALLTLLRARRRAAHRGVATLAVLLIAGLGPFLLRDLARGVNPSAAGVSIPLWLAWEVPLFLAAVSVLLAGAAAGRAALGGARGLHPAAAPLLAIGAAMLAPLVWEAPGRFPGWYPVPWIAAMAALALTRRTRALVLSAAIVAACGATTLVWGAVHRRWVALAEQEVASLNRSDPTMAELALRFADQLAAAEPPTTESELLARYVESAVVSAGYSVDLAAWRPDGTLGAELLHESGDPWPLEMAEAITTARSQGTPVVAEGRGAASRVLVVAVPYPDGWVAGAVIAPRTKLESDEPALVLSGLTEPAATAPPYTITLTTARDAVAGRAGWRRENSEMHGDWRVSGGAAPQSAHVVIALRPLDVLVQRGTLAVLLDLAIVALLWALSAIADGGFARWLGIRARRWARSYRARLTLALFAFFVVPGAAFAAWSWRRLREEDLQARSLLASEALRLATALPAGSWPRLEAAHAPVLVYENGVLRDATNPVYVELAPAGALLPPDVHLALDLGDEVSATRAERLGESIVLFGYRAAETAGRQPAVFATSAPTNEAAVEQRRRDLGILVLFATAVGALAALWLSGVAARQLAHPIGRLRRAALAIAAGEREPALAGSSTVEFQPVFSAFRRMASDLSRSREALEEAQRRTAAILRNVASGVIAVGPDASVTLANPRADALLGHPLPPGTRLSDAAPSELLEQLRDFLGGDEEDRSFDLLVGERQMRGQLTRLGREPGGAVITLEDVTDLSRAQRVLAWGEMARQVAHEIKNPLTPIRLGVQHLQRARGDRRVDFDTVFDQNMDRILREIDRLDEIARAFSRYGTPGTGRAAAEATDVAAVVNDAIGLEQLGRGDIQWRASGANRPVHALAQRDELREVLLNLLENARLANATRVDVDVRQGDGRVEIAVSDDGDGIDAEALPRIFDPQFSTRTSGSGLGLAVSRRVVEGWGGAIRVRSAPGEGTTVTVELLGR